MCGIHSAESVHAWVDVVMVCCCYTYPKKTNKQSQTAVPGLMGWVGSSVVVVVVVDDDDDDDESVTDSSAAECVAETQTGVAVEVVGMGAAQSTSGHRIVSAMGSPRCRVAAVGVPCRKMLEGQRCIGIVLAAHALPGSVHIRRKLAEDRSLAREVVVVVVVRQNRAGNEAAVAAWEEEEGEEEAAAAAACMTRCDKLA